LKANGNANWTPADSAELYGIRSWGAGYFDLAADGAVTVNVSVNGQRIGVSIPDIIEGMRSRGLQMPVLRVALAEPDFFSGADHPARRLIDRMGACVMGFEGNADLIGTPLEAEIRRLKTERNAVILAHYYQESEIQDLADYVGDSLGLSQQAASTEAPVIVFCGAGVAAIMGWIPTSIGGGAPSSTSPVASANAPSGSARPRAAEVKIRSASEPGHRPADATGPACYQGTFANQTTKHGHIRHFRSNSLSPNIMGQKPRSSPDVVDFRRHGPQIADSRIVDLKSPQRLLAIWRNRGG